MQHSLFHISLVGIAFAFSLFFFVTIGPALIENPDLIAGIMGGFVNPFASGYATDVILCAVVLALWVVHDARQHGIKHGWICIVLSLVPGVVVGFALYLIIRERQLTKEQAPHNA